MPPERLRSAVMNQRGIALPLALIVLMLLTSLTLVFLGLSSTEPIIAANLKRGEEALGLAEAGIDRAIWALSNPTVDTAGPNTKLTDLAAIPAAYSSGASQLLFPLTAAGQANQSGGYAVTIAGADPTTITAHGYVLRGSVALPVGPAQLNQSDIAAHRVVVVQVKGGGSNNRAGGPAAPGNVALPGALTVAGSVEMSGNSLVDGNDQADGSPNSCAKKGGVTIRDKSKISSTTEVDNTIKLKGSASTVGTPGQQELGYDDFAPFTFGETQLAALKTLAQQQGTYIKPTSTADIIYNAGNPLPSGLVFVDTVNGQALSNPPDASQLASVKITGANTSGWLIVMGSIRIDGNVTYNGFIYAHNDLSYKGTGTGGIYGGVLTGNALDTVATVVDTDTSGNSKIYFDCGKIASGGGTLTPEIQDALNRTVVTVTKGTWRELSN